jgi:hypothetical protein
MSTYTIQPQERRHHATERSLRHPLLATVAALAAAVLVGVLVGIFFSLLFDGAKAAPMHRAGGHALPTVATAQHMAAAAVSAETGDAVVAAQTSRERSPARGGFAVGRTAGAGSGFIVIAAGTRAPARGGFPGRSLGAGYATGDSVADQTAAR